MTTPSPGGQDEARSRRDRRRDIMRRHRRSQTASPARAYCPADNQDWPCDVAWLLTHPPSGEDVPGAAGAHLAAQPERGRDGRLKVWQDHGELPESLRAAAAARSCGDPDCHDPAHALPGPDPQRRPHDPPQEVLRKLAARGLREQPSDRVIEEILDGSLSRMSFGIPPGWGISSEHGLHRTHAGALRAGCDPDNCRAPFGAHSPRCESAAAPVTPATPGWDRNSSGQHSFTPGGECRHCRTWYGSPESAGYCDPAQDKETPDGDDV